MGHLAAVRGLVPRECLKRLPVIATGPEELQLRYIDTLDLYFLSDVAQGLKTLSLGEWKRLPNVVTHTRKYLKEPNVSDRLDVLVEILRTRKPAKGSIPENGASTKLTEWILSLTLIFYF